MNKTYVIYYIQGNRIETITSESYDIMNAITNCGINSNYIIAVKERIVVEVLENV